MKDFIKHKLREALLLKEQMQSAMNGKFQTRNNYHNMMLIAKDENNEKENYLVLSVNLVPNNDSYELTYGFSVYDINSNIVGSYMYSRDEVSKYLPIELKKQITPKVLEMTKDLINKIKPNKIYMETYESNIDGDSLKRFENLAQFLIDVNGYKIKEGFPRKNNDNKWEWTFISENGKEELMTEEMLLEYSSENRWKRLNERLDKVLTPEFLKEWLITSRK